MLSMLPDACILEGARLLQTGSALSRHQMMPQSKGNALLEAGMEIPTEICFHFLPGACLALTPKAPASCCSSSNYSSSQGEEDLHLCCNYSSMSAAKGSEAAEEEERFLLGGRLHRGAHSRHTQAHADHKHLRES